MYILKLIEFAISLYPFWGAGKPQKAPLGFEPRISCLIDSRFNKLRHGANTLASFQINIEKE